MRIAMLSYNAILPDRQNGWVDESLYMIQSDKGKPFGAQQFGIGTLSELHQAREDGISQVHGMVKNHWEQLAAVLPELDAVVIYVGDNGSEHTIKYAAERQLESSKAVFVLCSCNMHNKKKLIAENGFGESRVVQCECGGRRMMARMANEFLQTGQLAA